MDKILTPADAPLVAMTLRDGDNALFTFSVDNVFVYTMFIAPTHKPLSLINAGGNATHGRFIAGLLYLGSCFHFDPMYEQHASYIGEKLGLRDKDAKAVTAMLNAVFAEYRGFANNA